MISGDSSDRAVLRELGARLARTRLERNVSQQQLATEAGLSKRTIERIEAGEESKLSNLVRVLRALGMLDRLDALVPEPLPSPIEQLKLHGRRRRRAGRAAARRDEPPRPWTWGDEPDDRNVA
ncbi:helix-turn-helix domain-containing protein [Conexibacter arvalis]|uniref:Transcriptional regulator with XRE-family HTH domain n=1 Tax=Conexibacter arvalis TaxID=912552 RepID=A0A840IDC0_9ACTN|nr:helix-turn-helix transcriptional regulator [Conexibacter arvalis]MBB4662345.1 transcriptional regulator with XRE-family HTH domain [Conexibacter arvalis]